MAADVLAALAERVLLEAEGNGFHRPPGDFLDAPAYTEGVQRSATLGTECVRRLRELESNASGVAAAYQRTEEAVARRFR